MVNKSAAKGGAYERKIKDVFTKYYGIQFERVPSSGALSYLKGDIWAPHHMHLWHFTMECKHYKELDFTNLLTASSSNLHSFWKQAYEESEVMSKLSKRTYYPLVIFRWNRSKDYICWDTGFNCKSQLEVKAFNLHYKISLLDDFMKENKDLKDMIVKNC